MKYFSTRDVEHRHGVDLKTALLTGLAADGGLYLPQTIPQIDAATMTHWRGLRTFAELAKELARRWFGDEIDPAALRSLVHAAYTFPVPLVRVGSHHVCELFHGPSFSFKDVAAQLFARLLDHLLERDREDAVILTATSGDTGSAVAAACYGRTRIRAVIVYPKGRISPTQERQIATWGGNITAIAVHGSFDDCQRLVKSALATCAIPNVHLTSANSINIGRLLPQTFYYWWLALQQPHATMVVPSGNFGNLTAGVMAQRMGAPIADFIAATNVNDAVPRYLALGAYAPHATQHTVANAMDVGAPSNFERLRFLYHDDWNAMREAIQGVVVTDDQIKAAMAQVHADYQYLIDPHTAVAWVAAQQCRGGANAETVLLSTAHPAKFPELYTSLIGMPPPMPEALQESLHKPMQTIEMPNPTDAALHAVLQEI